MQAFCQNGIFPGLTFTGLPAEVYVCATPYVCVHIEQKALPAHGGPASPAQLPTSRDLGSSNAEALSPASVAALFDKVGGSLEDVQSATTLNWSFKDLTDDDCKLIAHLIASGSLAQLKVSSRLTDPFPAIPALLGALS